MPSSAVPSRKPKRRDSVVQHQRQALLSVNGGSGSKTFGEVGPELLGLLNLSELLSPTDLMLDLGAGIGYPAMCNTVSYEIGLAPSRIAGTLFRAVARKCRDNGYPISHTGGKLPPAVPRNHPQIAGRASISALSAGYFWAPEITGRLCIFLRSAVAGNRPQIERRS
ncbi:hypothetical protein C8F04DRAFT_1314693 [Mycena alexandri]|uniref:Uncharacterized protein n=1 Tax=Mycena alexandri TaxID=1745969 RepID=A0AAD6S5Q9_9AGAR|nr:hypothetical protein C8F04DRAFT_1314693 [Mycena alexandri]